MIDSGVIECEAPAATSVNGRPAQVYRRLSDRDWSAVISVGYSQCAGQLRNSVGAKVASFSAPIASPKDVLKAIYGVGSQLAKIAGPHRVPYVLVGIIGIVTPGGDIHSDGYRLLNDRAWMGELAGYFSAPTKVIVCNDAKVAAIWMDSYLRQQLSLDPSSIIALHCSEAVGLALVVGGHIWEGAHGAAGEISLSSTSEWQQVSAYLRAIEERQGLRQYYKTVGNEPGAHREFIETLGELLARPLSELVDMFDPDALCISGAIVDCGPEFKTRLTAEVQQRSRIAPEVYFAPAESQPIVGGLTALAQKLIDFDALAA